MSQPLAVYDNDIVPAEQLLSSLVTSQGEYTFPTNRCLRSITFLISNRWTAPIRSAFYLLVWRLTKEREILCCQPDHLLAERRIKKISNRAPKERGIESLSFRSLVMRDRVTDSGEGAETERIDNDRSVHPGNVGRVITARPNRTELLKCKLIGVRLTKQSPGARDTVRLRWSVLVPRSPRPHYAAHAIKFESEHRGRRPSF